MDATTDLLLALCRAELSGPEVERARRLLQAPVDWSRLAELACLHGVVAIVRRNLALLNADVLVPGATWELMQRAAAQIAFDGMAQLRYLRRIVQTLRQANIDPIVLKGLALAQLLYSDPVLRPAVDIDLLVLRAEVLSARQALEAVGLQAPSKSLTRFQLDRGYHLTLIGESLPGQPMELELHWALSRPGVFPLDLAVLHARSERFEIERVSTRRLSIEDTLLYLALHMRKHRYVGLRWLCDVAELLRQFGDRLDWSYVLSSAQSAGLRTLLYMTLAQAQDYLEASVPPDILQQLRPSLFRFRLLRSILSQDAVLAPVEQEETGWTRLAPAEILLLDRPGTMWRELGYKLFPPAETQYASSADSNRLALNARRLARRTSALLRR